MPTPPPRPHDRIILGINRDEDVRWMPGTDSYRYRRMVTIRMLKAVFESEEVPCLLRAATDATAAGLQASPPERMGRRHA